MEAAKRVEAAVAGKFGAASKEYTAKGRSLIFNLQKNAQLRAQLVAGVLSVDWLVTASTACVDAATPSEATALRSSFFVIVPSPSVSHERKRSSTFA